MDVIHRLEKADVPIRVFAVIGIFSITALFGCTIILSVVFPGKVWVFEVTFASISIYQMCAGLMGCKLYTFVLKFQPNKN
jgi:hypothetical protein